ncbi:MAG: hypothetical protein BroJett011_62490 [Chloroflexota bacterium]|nr:MAG: hypothetical protein BroJett011_62490 [Chloroflexota bacterium]
MNGTLDFLGRGNIPLLAFLKRCRGSGGRPSPVIMGLYVVRYECAHCGARFGVAEVEGNTTPDHEAAESRAN